MYFLSLQLLQLFFLTIHPPLVFHFLQSIFHFVEGEVSLVDYQGILTETQMLKMEWDATFTVYFLYMCWWSMLL